MVRKGEGGMGWGTAFLFAQNSLFRIVTHQMLIVFVIYSWGAAAPPDLWALNVMCTCLFSGVIWVLDCCVYQIDKQICQNYAQFFAVPHS